MPALDVRGLACALAAFAAVVLLAAASGGYNAQSWGWAGLATASVALLAIVVRGAGPQGRRERLFVGLLVLAGLWALASSAWSLSAPSSILDAQRHLVSAGGALAAVAIARRQDGPALRLGVLAAISVVCVANLVHRAHGYEGTTGAEAAPIGYANGLGILAAIGCLLALEAGRTWRPAWLALPLPAALLILSESTGAQLALVVGLAVAAIGRGGRARVLGTALLVAGLALGVVSFSGHQRELYWGVAWEGVREHPLGGSGAGTFAQLWVLDRDVARTAQDAHGLYIETLAEQGPLGLVLLAVALAVPLLAGSWRRRPLAVGAYAAALAHAGADWDWELTSVALATVILGASLVVEVRDEREPVSYRPLWLASSVALAAASAVTLCGALALDRARQSFGAGRLSEAQQRASQATRLAPWSTEAALVRAEILVAGGERQAARAVLAPALERDPREWRLWVLLARASEGADRERALGRARSLNPLGGI